MRFKRGITASLGLILAVAGICSAAPSTDPQNRPDIWRLDSHMGNARSRVTPSTSVVTLDADGDFKPGRHAVQDLGESTDTWREIYAVAVIITSGIVNVHETFVDLSSGVNSGMTPLGVSIPTSTLLESPTTYVAVNVTQTTGAPRNLICFSSAGAGVPNTTTTLIMSATFYGYNGKGEFVSEWIQTSTNSISWSTTTVSNTTDVVKYVGVGNVAFAYVSSFTVQITSMTNAFGLSTAGPIIVIGFGQKIGLANNVEATADVYKITNAGGADVTNPTLNPLISIDTTYDTIVFSPQPNGVDEKGVWYKVKRSN